ncbi:hypothetical protein EON63_01690 [archaeon]|nr:MAG: hypothetical protein EON63_01690 [archaeon]
MQFASQLYPIRSNNFRTNERARLSIYLDGENLAECTILIYIYLRHSLFPTPQDASNVDGDGGDDVYGMRGRGDVDREIKERIQHTEQLLYQYDVLMSTRGGNGGGDVKGGGEQLDVVRASDTTLGYTAVPLHPHLFHDGAYEGWHHIITYTYLYTQPYTFTYTHTLPAQDKDAVYHAQSIGQMYVGVYSRDIGHVDGSDTGDLDGNEYDSSMLPSTTSHAPAGTHDVSDSIICDGGGEGDEGDVSDLVDLRAMEYEGLRLAMRELDELKSKLRGEVHTALPTSASSLSASHAQLLPPQLGQSGSGTANTDVAVGVDVGGEDPFMGLSLMKSVQLDGGDEGKHVGEGDIATDGDGVHNGSVGVDEPDASHSQADYGSMSYGYDMDFEQSLHHNLPDIGDEYGDGNGEEVYAFDFESAPPSSPELESVEVHSDGNSDVDGRRNGGTDSGDGGYFEVIQSSMLKTTEDEYDVDVDNDNDNEGKNHSNIDVGRDDGDNNVTTELDLDAANDSMQHTQSPVEDSRGEGVDVFKQSGDSTSVFHTSITSVRMPDGQQGIASLIEHSAYSIHTPLTDIHTSHLTHTAYTSTPLGVHLVDQAVGPDDDGDVTELSLTDESVQVSLDNASLDNLDGVDVTMIAHAPPPSHTIIVTDVSMQQGDGVDMPQPPAPSSTVVQEERIAEMVRRQVLEILQQEAMKPQSALMPAPTDYHQQPATLPVPAPPPYAAQMQVPQPNQAKNVWGESKQTYLSLSQLPERSSRLLAECGVDGEGEVEGDMDRSHISSAGSTTSTVSSSAARSARLQELVQRSISTLHPPPFQPRHQQTASVLHAAQMKFPGQKKRFVDQETERVSQIMRGLLHKKD